MIEVFSEKIMTPLFQLLEFTQGVQQLERHHPEGDVFIHSIQVMNIAFRETSDTDLILAAMLHDVGKAWKSHGHAKIGADVVRTHVSEKTRWLIEHHMRFWDFILGDMKKLSKVKFLIDHPWLGELSALARFDKMGRKKNYIVKYDKSSIIERLNECVPERYKNEKPEKSSSGNSYNAIII